MQNYKIINNLLNIVKKSEKWIL
jgi:hypothetical protein